MDDLAFEEEALRHLRELWNVALRIVRDEAIAEEVLQECYLRAYERRHELRRREAFRAWLVAICRTVSLNRLKKERRRRHLMVVVDEESLSEGLDGLPGADLSLDALGQLETSDVGRALAGLPSTMREAVTLRDVAELSYEEIAAIQGAPPGTVRSRIARGRRRLAKVLGSLAKREKEGDAC